MKVVQEGKVTATAYEATAGWLAKHEAVVAERDQLRSVLRDVLEERGLSLNPNEVEGCRRALALLKADGCYDCAFPTARGPETPHVNHPNGRAAGYRVLFAPGPVPGIDADDKPGWTVRGTLLRVLEVLVMSGGES